MKIKPCPWCAEIPKTEQDLHENGFISFCANNDCPIETIQTDLKKTKSLAIKAWNIRRKG